MKQTKTSEQIENNILTEFCHLKDKNVLEIGCGSGKYTFRIVNWTKQLTGIEPPQDTPGVLSLPEVPPELKEKLDFVETFPSKMKFEDESFDTAVASCSFHEIPHEHQDATLKEAHRVLKKGGKLVLIDPSPESFLHNFVRIVKPQEDHGLRVRRSNEKIYAAIESGLFEQEEYFTYAKDYIFGNIEAMHNEIIENWARMNKPKTEEERKEWVKKINDVVSYKKDREPIVITELVQIFILTKC